MGGALLLAATAATSAAAAAAAAAAAPAATAAPVEQSLEDAWWTGPMLAPSPATMPPGHALIEPYLFAVISNGHFDENGKRHSGPYEHDFGSLTYVLYGVTDHVTAGLIPRFSYNVPADGPSSSGIGFGDLTLQASYGLTQFSYDHRVPTIALVVQETLPTGRYDRLTRTSDGFGAGAWTTTLAVYSQDYFWMPNGRILRTRLDVSYNISSAVSVHDVSVYGTPQGFVGQAWPGDSLNVDLAGEYSITSNWVLALDVVYQHNDNTRVSGSAPGTPLLQAASGTSYSLGFAPAIEYNWNARVGLLLGVRVIQIGRNTTASVTPAIALNMVF
ncbi:MAG TPA: hypothetical protein VKB72_12400 [Steroidobacteraceae bacterium]|nr:hypothetical protein [Steroidobacteraceae bacterium]